MASNQSVVEKPLSLSHLGLQRELFYKTLPTHDIRIFTGVNRPQTDGFRVNTRVKQTNPPVNRLITDHNSLKKSAIHPAT